jgi:sugar phosphate isomerase/epimerase
VAFSFSWLHSVAKGPDKHFILPEGAPGTNSFATIFGGRCPLAPAKNLEHHSGEFGGRGGDMRDLSRRSFMKSTAMGITAAGLASAGASSLGANPLGLPIGCQTYPVRALIAQDFPGTIKTLADAGFTSIELCSPTGYKEFADVGTYKGPELRKILSDSGITCISCHFGIKELQTNLEDRIAWAKDVGLTQMMVPLLNGPKNPAPDDVKKSCDDLNVIAAEVAKAGMQQGLHNEGWLGQTMADGTTKVYDAVFTYLDPKLVKFQFQVSQIAAGFDAVTYLTKYAGRFISMHCQGWDATNKKIVAMGSPADNLDWKAIFAAAKTGGIKDYYVEMDLDLMKQSVPYLKSLQV